jgi:hypothetical protein
LDGFHRLLGWWIFWSLPFRLHIGRCEFSHLYC